MSLENHSLNSSWESNNVGMMKCNNAQSWNKHENPTWKHLFSFYWPKYSQTKTVVRKGSCFIRLITASLVSNKPQPCCFVLVFQWEEGDFDKWNQAEFSNEHFEKILNVKLMLVIG
jgi:hypothetical protein